MSTLSTGLAAGSVTEYLKGVISESWANVSVQGQWAAASKVLISHSCQRDNPGSLWISVIQKTIFQSCQHL